MLINGSHLNKVPILSVQTGTPIAITTTPIIDPDRFQIIGFKIASPLVSRRRENILDASSIREVSQMGMIIDSDEELVAPDDVIKIQQVLELDFSLIGLKVETKKGSKLGKVINFTVTPQDFFIQQLIVQRPPLKSLFDTELIIPRSEIVEVNQQKIIVKDEEKIIKQKFANEEFVPNFVNPFRKTEPDFAPSQNQTLDEPDS